jgi:hypothetical protein
MNEMDLSTIDPTLLQMIMSGQMLGPQEEEQARMFAQADELRNQGVAPGDHGMMVGGQWMPNYGGLAQRGMGAYHGDKMQRQASGMGEGIAQERGDQYRRAMAAYGMRGQAPQQVTQEPMPPQQPTFQPVPQQQPPMPRGGMMPAPPGNPAPMPNPLQATPLPWPGGR